MNQEQLLRGVISAKEAMLGDTPAGADWCIKALHPSDPLTQVRGIPDMSAACSVCVNYQSTFTLTPEVGATDTWSWDATMLPHPVDFMAYQTMDSTGGMNGNFNNSQIAGATHGNKMITLLGMAQQWRLCYAGVTITQDGPDLANQGTIVVAQTPLQPYKLTACGLNAAGTAVSMGWPILMYSDNDMPDYTTSQSMPSAYFDNSKKGAYIPLKLTKTCQEWVSQSDLVGHGELLNTTVNTPSFATQASYAWPHWDLPVNYLDPGVTNVIGFSTSPMLSECCAHVSVRNVSIATSFSFFFRYGIEYRVHPSSVLATQLELAPRYDPRALTSYFSISRELKDAYEAKFNDLGKLWGVISGVAKQVLPFVGSIGPMGKAISTIGSGVVTTGDIIHAKRQKQKKAKPQPPPIPSRSTKPTRRIRS
jgi:hypothetical protein